MAELEKMRAAGLLVWKILEELRGMVAEGVSTYDLEVRAEKMMQDAGAKSAFKGYSTATAGKYPAVLCTSVNEEIVHGMPSPTKVLKKGDIVSIDTGVQLHGYFGDSAITVGVGEISAEAQKLMDVTRESLELAIEKARPGNRLFDICGIGTSLHEEPQVPNYVDRRGENPRLKEGMVLAIEPMVNAGKPGSRVKADKWTAVTEDGRASAHFEHTVAITANGPWVLTRP
jgi:methionyl aminopeptidase